MPGVVKSNRRGGGRGGKSGEDTFIEIMKMQMLHEMQQSKIQKEMLEEKRVQEERDRQERREEKEKDRAHFQQMFLMAIGGGINAMTNSPKRKKSNRNSKRK